MPTSGEQTPAPGGRIEVSVVPGDGTVVFLRGTVDVRLVGELERVLHDAELTHPPVTVDLSDTVSLDGPIVDVLAAASASFPGMLRVRGAGGGPTSTFDLYQVEHLRGG